MNINDIQYAIRLRRELNRNYDEYIRIKNSKNPIWIEYRCYLLHNMREIKKELKEIGVR